MRILYSHYLSTDTHAAAQMVHSIAGELRKLGHEVIIHRSAGESPTISRSPTKQMSSRGWKHFLKKKLWFLKAISRNSSMLQRDRRAITEVKPDVVLCRQDAYCWSMAKACKQLGVKLVTYADAPVAYETRLFNTEHRWNPPGLVEKIERWVLHQSEAIITVSRPAANQLRRYDLKVPIHVIPNGIHPDRFHDSDEIRKQLRYELNLSDRVLLGFQGTFRPFHGIELLKRIMLGMQHRQDIHWLLIGDGPAREDLQKAVSDRVSATFLGRQPENQMGTLLQLLDIAVVPHSLIQGEFYFCPLKILECAGAGAAVVAGEQGDIPWLLAEGKAGVIIRGNQEKTWIEEIEKLIDDREYRHRIAIRGKQRIHETFTWRKTAVKVESVLKGCS